MRWQLVVDQIKELDEPVLVLDPRETFDPCLVGLAQQFHNHFAVYSRRKVIETYAKEMGYEEAVEYFDFNVIGAYMGEHTPAFLLDDEELLDD